MRAFIAAEIQKDVKDRLAEAAQLIDFPEIRHANKEKIHLTLAFIGDLGEDKVDIVKNIMDNSMQGSFDLEIKGFIYFGNPGAIYAAVAVGAEDIGAIATAIRSGLKSAGIDFDGKEFVPHVTIAKIKTHMEESSLEKALNQFGNTSFGTFRLNTISLFKSTLSEGGAIFERLYERKR